MNRIFFGIVAASFVFAILNGTPTEVGKRCARQREELG